MPDRMPHQIEVGWENALLPPLIIALFFTVGLFIALRKSQNEQMVSIRNVLPAGVWFLGTVLSFLGVVGAVYWSYTLNSKPMEASTLSKALSWGLIPVMSALTASLASLAFGTNPDDA